MSTPLPDRMQQQRLRWQLYNATLVSVRRAHDGLAVFRVRGDRAPALKAGQYTLLGLGDWEGGVEALRPAGVPQPAAPQVEHAAAAMPQKPRLIRRPYSVTCSLIDESGNLVRIGDGEALEFYIALVQGRAAGQASLTSRLFALREGDRLFLGEHARGRYTLAPVQRDDDVIFCATGTGEAPHNAMIAELLGAGHAGRIVSAVSVRQARDLAYLDAHRRLERRFANYRYVPLTTREPCNLDATRVDFAGRRHLQDVLGSDDSCRQALGFVPQPGRAHVFLCGSPAMIGLPKRQPDGTAAFPSPVGMAEVLRRRGFKLDEPNAPGNVHFEKYW